MLTILAVAAPLFEASQAASQCASVLYLLSSAIRTLHLCVPHENSVPSAPASEGVYPLRVGCKPGFVFQGANKQSPCVLGACDSATRRVASPAAHLAIVAPPGTARQFCNPEGCQPLAGG